MARAPRAASRRAVAPRRALGRRRLGHLARPRPAPHDRDDRRTRRDGRADDLRARRPRATRRHRRLRVATSPTRRRSASSRRRPPAATSISRAARSPRDDRRLRRDRPRPVVRAGVRLGRVLRRAPPRASRHDQRRRLARLSRRLGERSTLYKLLKGEELDTNGGLVDQRSPARSRASSASATARTPTLPDDVKDSVVEGTRARADAGGRRDVPALRAARRHRASACSAPVALLAYLGVRLLLAAILTLLLLLFAPAMLLAPAFGDSGRATFIAWVKRLVGAIAAKLIYALFLAVVLAARSSASRARHRLVRDVAAADRLLVGRPAQAPRAHRLRLRGHDDRPSHAARASMLSRAYYAGQLGRVGSRRRARRRPAGRRNGGPRRAPRGASARRREPWRRAAIASEQARRTRARDALSARQRAATQALVRRDSDQREVAALDRHLAGYDEARAAARARRRPRASLGTSSRRRCMLAAERCASVSRTPSCARPSRSALRAERAQAETGEAVATAGRPRLPRAARPRAARGPPAPTIRDTFEPQGSTRRTTRARAAPSASGCSSGWPRRSKRSAPSTTPPRDGAARSAIDPRELRRLSAERARAHPPRTPAAAHARQRLPGALTMSSRTKVAAWRGRTRRRRSSRSRWC